MRGRQKRYVALGIGTVNRGKPADGRVCVAQNLDPLAAEVGVGGLKSRDIALGPRQTRRKPAADRISNAGEDNRNCVGQSMQLSDGRVGGNDDKIGCRVHHVRSGSLDERWVATGPAVVDP